MKTVALVFAAGTGERYGSHIPKQFIQIHGKEILVHTCHRFEVHPQIDEYCVVVSEMQVDWFNELKAKYALQKAYKVIAGGVSGLDSVYKGLQAIRSDNLNEVIVLIHDGVRPIVEAELISASIKSVKDYGNGIAVAPQTECVLQWENGILKNTVNRDMLYVTKAPHGFYLSEILTVFKENYGLFGTTHSVPELAAAAGLALRPVICSNKNIKITFDEDFYLASKLLET